MKTLKGQKGFTLIELLVVVAIIGILVAIAIPQFASYKKSANDSTASAQLRNLAVAMESYYTSNNTYAGPSTSTLTGYNSTANVTVTLGTQSTTAFTATSYHSGGSRTYTWSSSSGGLL